VADQTHLVIARPVDRPVVGLCTGKDCRKRCEFSKVQKVLDRDCEVVHLKCVGLCDGPVVVVEPHLARPSVYSKLRTKRQRSLLSDLISGDARARKELAARRVTKKKVVAAVVRQVKRRTETRRRAA